MQSTTSKGSKASAFNVRLREVFKELHSTVVNGVNASSVIDQLFANGVLSEADNLDLDQIGDRRGKCRRLLALLYASGRPDAFVQLRSSLAEDAAYEWIVDEIDRLVNDATEIQNFDEVDSGQSGHAAAAYSDVSGLSADVDRKPTAETQQTSNSLTPDEGVEEMHGQVTKMANLAISDIDASALIRRLVDDGILDNHRFSPLLLGNKQGLEPDEQWLLLLTTLNSIDHPRAFVALRHALTEEVAYKWIVDEIDMKCTSVIFDRSRPPCRRRTQLMVQHRDLPSDVFGLARLDNRIFVACYRSDFVTAYSADSPYNRVGTFRVGVTGLSLSEPCDMAACAERKLLYIGDRTGIWVLKVTENEFGMERWIRTVSQPWTLSVRSGRLLVTPWNDLVDCDVSEAAGGTGGTWGVWNMVSGSCLHQYGIDGRISMTIRLPVYVEPRHSVETTRRTFVVCYLDRESRKGQLMEIDATTRILNQFNVDVNELTQLRMNYIDVLDPVHMMLDADGRVLVADCSNRRVVVFDGSLKPVGILVDHLDAEVYRIYFDETRAAAFQMFVGCYGSRSLSVYRLL